MRAASGFAAQSRRPEAFARLEVAVASTWTVRTPVQTPEHETASFTGVF